MSWRRTLSGCCIALACLPALAVVERGEIEPGRRERQHTGARARSAELTLREASPAAHAAREFVERRGGEWSFRVDPRTGRVNSVRGSGVPLFPGAGNELEREALKSVVEPDGEIDVRAAEPTVRALLEELRPLLGPDAGVLELDPGSSLSRESGRLVSFNYRWRVGDVPVEGALVFVRVNSGNVVQFGSHLVGPVETATVPAIDAAEAVRLLLDHAGDAEVARLQGKPELVLQPEETATGRLDYRLVWKFRYKVLGELETWEGRVDAISGAVVGFGDVNQYARVLGGVYPESPYLDAEVKVPFPYTDVKAGAQTITTNLAGYVSQPFATVSSTLSGKYFDIDCAGCTNPAQPLAGTTVGAGRLDFGLGGVDAVGNGFSTPADRTTFYHLNQVRRIAQKWLPGESWLNTTNFTATVNIGSNCNAYYDGVSVNFYRSGGGCNNTGEIADVVRHEWGHGLDLNTLGGDGGTGEGTADVVAMHMSHSSQMGPGFRITGAPVRDLDKDASSLGPLTKSRIDDGACNILVGGDLSVHCVGQVFGQTAWDLAQTLIGKYGHHTGWRTSERLFFTSLPDAGTYDPASPVSIYEAYLIADDDDGNLANGTPNGQEIHDAFDVHEIAQGTATSSSGCARPAQPVVSVNETCGTVEVSWTPVAGASHYQVFRAEVREDTAYFPLKQVASTQSRHVDDQVYQGVDYWYVVMAVAADGCESTVESPAHARLADVPVLQVTAMTADDTPLGNRSGFPDPGEQVDVRLTLANFGSVAASAVSGRVFALTPGVTMQDDAAAWPAIEPGATAVNTDTIRFKTTASQVSCGSLLQFAFRASDASGCSSEASFFEVRVGKPNGSGGYVCDPTPPCFVEPTFNGLASAAPGASCGEALLAWEPATSNCTNATISYNVYRSSDPTFSPGPETLHASGVMGAAFVDSLLVPGEAYNYIVRAVDSRSGEEANTAMGSVVAPAAPDLKPPVFAGIANAASGGACGETVLAWSAAAESCNAPVAYEIYRSGDPGFVPGPEHRIGSTLSTGYVDAALPAGTDQTYVVRARDGVGNLDGNEVRVTVAAGAVDLVAVETGFEPDNGGWQAVSPNTALDGRWEWGDPVGTPFQPEDDATADGVNCWITGLTAGDSNGDVDEGTTTLRSARYDLTGMVSPRVRYSRWFTNDQGNAPGEATDSLRVEVSDDDGVSWTQIDEVGEGTPLAWVTVEHDLGEAISSTSQVRFRFTAADQGEGSLVEAGIDDFRLYDPGQGCQGCALPAIAVQSIRVDRAGDDVLLDWSDDPAPGTRFVVYKFSGAGLAEALRVGSTSARSFVHEGAALATEDFFYRVTAVDACGNESE